MKVLTIKEPWASLILEGKKVIETRTWKTKYRGVVLLHASQNPKSDISGKIFAVANIENCLPMIRDDERLACCEVYPNAYSWFLSRIKPTELKEVKGKLGLWEFDCVLKSKDDIYEFIESEKRWVGTDEMLEKFKRNRGTITTSLNKLFRQREIRRRKSRVKSRSYEWKA